MISIYLCEEDCIWLARLHKAVADYQIESNWETKIACETTLPDTLTAYLTVHPPHNGIYFLDMFSNTFPNGMELAKQIRRMDPNAFIIFVTVNTEMVMETFHAKIAALDYIIKDTASLDNQIHQCLNYIERSFLSQKAVRPDTITVRTDGFYHTFLIKEIYYVESVKNTHKVCVHIRSGNYIIPASLSVLQKHLGNDFLQCHKTCIVNMHHIKTLDSIARRVLLDNGEICNCSVRKWKVFYQHYQTLSASSHT